MKLYMFRTVPLCIIKSFSLYTQHWFMLYRSADSLRAVSGPFWSCSQDVGKPVWHIPLLCVQWKIPNDAQRNCPKHVEFHFKNKFDKLVHLVGFIVSNLSRCTVTWKSNLILLSVALDSEFFSLELYKPYKHWFNYILLHHRAM